MNIKNKKLLVLGSTTISCEIIKQAKKQGAYVLVTDFLADSPGKKIADKSFMVSTTDVDAVVNLIKQEKIDGVLTGFIEWMLPHYQQICEKTGMYCYTTKEQLEITSNKIKFKELCKRFGVPVVEDYLIDHPFSTEALEAIKFPIIIKPADSEGGSGIFVCKNEDEFLHNYNRSLAYSKSKKVVVERYMTGKEVTVFYLMVDGEIHLNTMGDRYTKHFSDGCMPLPVGYIFPSKHLEHFETSLNNKVIKMLNSIGLKNGMIFIQSFVEDGECIFYEMGFRLTPSMEYKILSIINGINHLEMMINFALTGTMTDADIKSKINRYFDKIGCNLTYSVIPGKIGDFIGLKEIRQLPEVIDVVVTYNKGDIIPISATGTLKQVAVRVFVIVENKDKLIKTIDKINSLIRISSEAGDNLLLDVFDTKELLDEV